MLKKAIVQEVEQKISRLECKKHFSIRPVLVHVNGVSEEVKRKQFFAAIIDFSQMLQ